MKLELQHIEIKKSKAGDPAIQLVFKSDDDQWVREYIGLDKAPDFVWERWGKCFGIGSDAKAAKLAMTDVRTIFDILGSRCEAECETEEYQGREYVKIKNAKPENGPTDIDEPASSNEEVSDDDIPF
tara:strand:+ start:4159 stop:4539 length:381 start_codon:yes stop_codon:yes gene_type:complete